MAGGSSKDGPQWYENAKAFFVMLIVFASCLSLPYFRKLNDYFPSWHPAFAALVSGVIVTVLTYPPMRLADRKYAFSNSILLGLLVAEVNIYGAPFSFPAPILISFFAFMYYIGRQDADNLFPDTYNGSL